MASPSHMTSITYFSIFSHANHWHSMCVATPFCYGNIFHIAVMIASLYNGKRIETEKHKLKTPDLPDRILFADQKEDKEEGVREDQSQIPAKMKSKGMNLEEIVELTGLEISKLEKL